MFNFFIFIIGIFYFLLDEDLEIIFDIIVKGVDI